MNISSRQYIDSEKIDGKSYIQKNLVGFWDCQQNVGWNTYDPNFNGLTNLVTGHKIEIDRSSYRRFKIGYPYAHGGNIGPWCEPDVLDAFNGNVTYETMFGFEGVQVTGASGGFSKDGTFTNTFIISVNPSNFAVMPVNGWYIVKTSDTGNNILFSFVYDQNDVMLFVNGKIENIWKNIKFPEKQYPPDELYIGWEIANADKRRLICTRIYNNCLTSHQIYHNFKVDNQRYGDFRTVIPNYTKSSDN